MSRLLKSLCQAQFFVQIRLKMEAGDCPALNINAMRAISVKSYLKDCKLQYSGLFANVKLHFFSEGNAGINLEKKTCLKDKIHCLFNNIFIFLLLDITTTGVIFCLGGTQESTI